MTQSHRALTQKVPIRALNPRHRTRIAQHLLALSAQDRYLRFGYAAQDAHIQGYVDNLNFARDEIYGIFNRALVLIAVAHLAIASDPLDLTRAEFGVSVNQDARGKGYGAQLFERAVVHARNEGIDTLFIHALSENAAMLKIATNAGARVERHGSETEAFLTLPPATLDSRFSEAVEQQVGEMDFQFKWQAKRLWAFLSGVQGA
jgi:RimJ/RimL family protein N-acetyltransferase